MNIKPKKYGKPYLTKSVTMDNIIEKDPQIWKKAKNLRFGISSRIKKNNILYDDYFLDSYNIYNLLLKNKNCECCQIQLNFGKNKVNTSCPKSPSIDRIIPNKGYIHGNVAVLCHRCNRLKRGGSILDFENILNWIKNEMQLLQLSK